MDISSADCTKRSWLIQMKTPLYLAPLLTQLFSSPVSYFCRHLFYHTLNAACHCFDCKYSTAGYQLRWDGPCVVPYVVKVFSADYMVCYDILKLSWLSHRTWLGAVQTHRQQPHIERCQRFSPEFVVLARLRTP
jgi:hypothetical protein